MSCLVEGAGGNREVSPLDLFDGRGDLSDASEPQAREETA